uniref:Dip2/Utp12 Family, putative n=1 Tax=Theileria annulata TaxID=5874 RepID=A0A3B0N607_THEAN
MWHRGSLTLLCSSCRYVIRKWHIPILGVDCGANPRHKQSLSNPPPLKRNKSCSVMLTQALLTSDRKLVEKLLSTRDSVTIEDTVAELTPPLVLSLLEYITSSVIRTPNQLYSREGWINTLLRTHSAVFTGSKKGKNALIKLNKHINERLTMNKALLKLKGKVDSVVYYSNLYKKQKQKDSIQIMNSQEPLLTFTEE